MCNLWRTAFHYEQCFLTLTSDFLCTGSREEPRLTKNMLHSGKRGVSSKHVLEQQQMRETFSSRAFGHVLNLVEVKVAVGDVHVYGKHGECSSPKSRNSLLSGIVSAVPWMQIIGMWRQLQHGR